MASSMPPATAGPSTAAMTGFDSSSRDGPSGPRGALMALGPPPLGKSRLPTGSFMSRSDTVLRSQPAQKAPPSPQNTATWADGSASNCSKAATSASALSGSMALRASGRLWMTVQTEPDFSMRTAIWGSVSGEMLSGEFRLESTATGGPFGSKGEECGTSELLLALLQG